MAHQLSCRGCRHCQPPQAGAMGWCRLRQLAIHPELAGELWCPHWTARAPRLPTLRPLSQVPVASATQLHAAGHLQSQETTRLSCH